MTQENSHAASAYAFIGALFVGLILWLEDLSSFTHRLEWQREDEFLALHPGKRWVTVAFTLLLYGTAPVVLLLFFLSLPGFGAFSAASSFWFPIIMFTAFSVVQSVFELVAGVTIKPTRRCGPLYRIRSNRFRIGLARLASSILALVFYLCWRRAEG